MAQRPLGGEEETWSPVLHTVLRLLGGAAAILLLLALLSFSPRDPQPGDVGAVTGAIHNWCGSAGAFAAGLLHTFAGWGSLLVPLYLAWECWPHAEMEGFRAWAGRLAWLAAAFAAWTLLGGLPAYHWASEPGGAPLELRWGGWMGSVLWPALRHVFGPVGLPLLMGLLLVLASLILAPVLSRATARLLARWMGEKAWPFLKPMPGRGVRGFLTMAQRPFLKWRDKEPEELSAEDLRAIQQHSARQEEMEAQREALIRAEMEAAELRRRGLAPDPQAFLPAIQSVHLEDAPPEIQSMRLETRHITPSELPPGAFRSKLLAQAPPPPTPKAPLAKAQVTKDRYGREAVQAPLPLTEPTPSRPLPSMRLGAEATQPPQPTLPPTPQPAPQPTPPRPKLVEPGPADREELPPRRLFDPPQPHGRVDPAVLERIRETIGAKLAEFKIKGQVVGLQPGPVVTVFEFQPDAGIPLSRILGMEEDLALALQAEKVRMDRIPGKNLVGIEVPNPTRELITFREVIDTPAFREGSSLLSMALGKDIEGGPVVADLAKMPHLLIGGSTGSGKSVGVNAMICSVLLRALPHETKFILIDPKMVEMGIYENIPHLWAPVVTDMKEAGRVLKWVVAQMEDRYRRLMLLSVRDLESFNQKLREAGGRIDLSARTPNPRWPDRPKELEPLPYVVVVIDELADLMMVARSEVEDSIARIAQKARAVGIHLVLATQRPSVDVVTGVIKANLPARISYRVNTKIDSRTILDGGGGEQLLGKGDALFLAPGASRPRRVHAPFLTEAETLRLVAWLKERGKPDFNQALIKAMETDEEDAGEELLSEGGGSGDDVYDKAVAVVKRERKASTSLLQRKLNLGYGRAARLIDRMEEEGIIGPDRGAGKPREVLADE